MKHMIFVVIAAGSVLYALLALRQPGEAPTVRIEAASGLAANERGMSSLHSLGGLDSMALPFLAWAEDGFEQHYQFTTSGLVVLESAQDSNGNWTEQVFSDSAAFEIREIQSRGRNFFYVVGVSANQDVVVQRWRLKNRNFSRPGDPLPPRFFEKIELFRGSLGITPVSFDVDPGGRFLILLMGDPAGHHLYKMDLTISPPCLPGYLSAITPPTSEPFTNVEVAEHISLGRVWSFFTADAEVHLVDADNDGTFDDIYYGESASDAMLTQFGLGQWVDNFNGRPPL